MFFYTFMPKLFNMSLTASVAIVLVILLRLLLKKSPKVISYALWGVVLFRLLCPVSIGSNLSLYNLFDAPTEDSGTMTSVIEYVPSNIVHTEYPSVILPVPGVSDVINETLPQGQEQLVADPLEAPMSFATYAWIIGVLVMVIYSIVSYIRLRRKLSIVVPLRDNIFIADDVKSPFVVGLFRPKIYLPCNLGDKEQEYIILHEQHHIKRLDHVMKALAFLALAIHWFNPLVWVAFILASKDMEMSCDEAVIRKAGGDVRADYSASLLTLATGRRIIAGTPLAFGEGDTKGRINNLSKWKKPAVWIVVAAVLACAIVAVCLLTNPVKEVKIGDIESVTVDNISVSDEAADELISLINSHRCTPFRVGLDDPNSLSRAIQLNCANGDFYLLHYQYYSGYSFDPRHAGEDDYRSILTFFTSEEGGQKAWQMEYDFDAKLRDWLSEYSSPSFGAFSINHPYGVVEVTYENGITSFSMVAQVNTPEYMIDENKHLFSVKEHSDVPTWTNLGELSETTITKENFDDLFRNNSGEGWFGRESASEIRKNTVQAWSVIYNQDVLYYILQQRNGELYLAHGYYDYSEKNDPFSDDTNIRWLYKIAPNDIVDSAKGEYPQTKVQFTGELIPGTTYVSYQCLYMNPLSSYAAMGGDSGCKYIVGEDYFATIHRNDGSFVSVTNPNLDTATSGLDGLQDMIDVSNWEWQEFPYTDAEWAALYQPSGFGGIQNISEIYDEILYQPLADGKFLLRVDGNLWLVELRGNDRMGTYLWSIYSLASESAMGVAQWEYAPMLSSRSPYFRFEFDMDHTEISAVCTQSLLVDRDAPGTPSDTSLILKNSNALYWSPIDKDGNVVTAAIIHFSVHQDDIAPYSGTIYIEGNSGSGGRRIYNATIVGTGLHLAPNSEISGGVISAIASPNVIRVVEHDLTTGDLEVPVKDLVNYVFYTNSKQISVTVKGSNFDGLVNLLDVSQNNAHILQAKVNTHEEDCLFTGLTSARLYRVDCEGLEGCTIVISGNK